MTIRTFQPTDIPQILQIWNKATRYTPLNRRAFVKNFLLDYNFNKDGFFIAEEDGEILGYMYGVVTVHPIDVGGPIEEDKGHINAFGMKYPECFTNGTAQELLKKVEDYIRGYGKSKIFVSSYHPNYIYQSVNLEYTDYLKLFEDAGYVRGYRNASISIDLFQYQRPDEIDELKKQREAEGFFFTEMKDVYILAAFDFMTPGWKHRVRRLINETMDYEKISLIFYEGKVVGASMFGDPYSCDERFGPYVVDENFRGKGLGKILLHDCLTKMKERGLHRAWSQSTPLDSTTTFIYQKAGFVRTGEYVSLSKELKED